MNGTTFTRKILTCPACDADINATFSATLGVPETPVIQNGTVDVKLTVTGLSVNHSCALKPDDPLIAAWNEIERDYTKFRAESLG